MNFYGRNYEELRANLHTHTVNSDGKFTAAEVIDKYADAGYDVLAFSDHRTTNPVSTYSDRGMILISGIELHPAGPREILWHILALNIPEDFANCSDDEAQTVIDKIHAAGGVCFAAHPYWSGFTSAEVMSLRGSLGIEVYNTSTRRIGKAYNMQLWDECLWTGTEYNAIAVDDVHNEEHLFSGWTMILSNDRSVGGVMEALRAGRYYASQGPRFTRLSFENDIFEAEFTPCVEAIAVTKRSTGYGEIGKMITSIKYDTSKLKPGDYVRCQIKDANGNYAWSNPIFLS